MESTTMTKLTHDGPQCKEWQLATPLTMTRDGDLVYLDNELFNYGSWSLDETANCPWCSQNLYIELPDGELISPQAFLMPDETKEKESST